MYLVRPVQLIAMLLLNASPAASGIAYELAHGSAAATVMLKK